jgi:hypothetical protein
MRGNAVEKPAVVRNNHGATSKIFEAFFHGTQRIYINVVGRFVKQQDVTFGFQRQRQVQTVAFATRKDTTFFLLVGAL